MINENPHLFLKNNFFLQFLIADRFRIYRHVVACGSPLNIDMDFPLIILLIN